jgi:nucleotide-binding universal stress UspA family protein
MQPMTNLWDYQRIVLPLDGSETAELAVPFGVGLADQLGLPVMLVRVVDDADLPDLPRRGTPDPLVGEIMAAAVRANEYLILVSTRLGERGLTVTTEVRRGRTGQQLLAAMQAGDLVVIAASGHGARHTCLGSVAYTILGRARVPVLVVPSQED